MYRIESTGRDNDEKSFNRQKLKNIFFFTLDLAVLIVCIIALHKMFTKWKQCHYDFNAWAVCIVIFSSLSMLLNFATAYILFKRHSLQKETEREALSRIAYSQ